MHHENEISKVERIGKYENRLPLMRLFWHAVCLIHMYCYNFLMIFSMYILL